MRQRWQILKLSSTVDSILIVMLLMSGSTVTTTIGIVIVTSTLKVSLFLAIGVTIWFASIGLVIWTIGIENAVLPFMMPIVVATGISLGGVVPISIEAIIIPVVVSILTVGVIIPVSIEASLVTPIAIGSIGIEPLALVVAAISISIELPLVFVLTVHVFL